MPALKTRPTGASVSKFLAAVENEKRRAAAKAVNALMQRLTGEKGRMWGPSIVGFGSYRYANTAGKDFEWMLTGFSPRKANLVLYIMPGYGQFDHIMKKLGKFKTGKSCLYINRLEDVDMGVLEELVAASVRWMRRKYGA
ncbi:MAG: DUF1801 domain-containing protein [Pseudomonadota bacterium]|nr:DUF1801 domain-containing protein [Pseudomonadota bacterium]